MTEGFAWMKFDKNGFNNVDSSIDNIDILLMGSSHMEAVQIKQSNNLSEILNSETNYKVYNIGMSGHQIYNIVNNYDEAINFYKPSKYVIIETDRIDLDYKNMVDVINGDFKRIPSYDSGLLYYAQKIPAFKNMFKQVQDWIMLDKKGSSVLTNENNNYKETLYTFLSIVSNSSKNVKPIIFFHPFEELQKNGDINYIVDSEKLQLFKEVCNELGIVFIDMSSDFRKLYLSENKLAHGFSNTHVGSGHLNSYGHRVIADTIKEKITELEGDK